MHTTPQAIKIFARETLYTLTNIARTGASRFIVRAKNIATEEYQSFIVDCKDRSINKVTSP